MFMHRQLKEGKMFQLGKKDKKNSQVSEQNSFGTVSMEEESQNDEIEYQPPPFTNFKDFNVEQIAAQNNMAVICCGFIMCFLCTTIGIALFYFFAFDYVKPYIPFMQVKEDSLKFLTQINAKQYFSVNPMYAGQLHFARVPVQYWSHRIQMAKSMGLNALSVYVFWNYHEIQKGKFDFQTKSRNLTYFLQLCKQNDMKVLLRPGPYVCAQWDFGGLPARLLGDQKIEIRSSNSFFIEESKIYFEELSKVVRKYILNKENPQGTILMIQVQNEPSWFTNQVLYISKLKQLWDNINLNCPLYFDDTTKGLKNSTLYWQNAIIGMNPILYEYQDYEIFKNTSHFVFGGQVYSGWFMTWGTKDKWEKGMIVMYTTNFTEQFSNMLADNRSFSMYLVHGGTNFGLTAGYNMTTSYDYFAPISEQGRPTSNYHIFRSIIMNFTDNKLPRIPLLKQSMSVIFGQLSPLSSLFDNLREPLDSKEPLIFQQSQLKMYNQGMVMYETNLIGPKNYTFSTIIHDFAIIYVDGQFNQTVYRTVANFKKENQQFSVQCKQKQCKLQILVEALGHLSFGEQMKYDKKGILKFVQKDAKETLKLNWKNYRFDLNDTPKWKNNNKCDQFPCLYQIQVDLYQTEDTFINLKELKKGYVWVNGHALGRYWEAGPQYSLYCPGPWLKKGANKILVLDLLMSNANVTLNGQQTLRINQWI